MLKERAKRAIDARMPKDLGWIEGFRLSRISNHVLDLTLGDNFANPNGNRQAKVLGLVGATILQLDDIKSNQTTFTEVTIAGDYDSLGVGPAPHISARRQEFVNGEAVGEELSYVESREPGNNTLSIHQMAKAVKAVERLQ